MKDENGVKKANLHTNPNNPYSYFTHPHEQHSWGEYFNNLRNFIFPVFFGYYVSSLFAQ